MAEEEEMDAMEVKQNLLEQSQGYEDDDGGDGMENGGDEGDPDAVDTTADFLRVFQGKTEFDSWEEFSTLFEAFQKETGSAFKPRSATSIEYANERRVKDQIPDRFVYQTVKMVCQHYGNPVRKESSTRKRDKYIGQGCEAMVHLRYKSGTLNIVSCNLEHKNHKLFSGNEVIRSVRAFCFSDDIDFLMAKLTMEHNPFNVSNPEKAWLAIVEDLHNEDPNLKTTTPRVLKKRIRFLIDRYMSNSNGRPPVPDDEMGLILYELAKSKENSNDNVKQPTPGTGKKRGRPKKRKLSEDEDDFPEHLDFDDSENYSPGGASSSRFKSAASTPASSSSGRDMMMFLKFMERKDDQDRRMRQSEIDLRREELELHKRELELQKEKFEYERLERQNQLDLLKTQLETVTGRKIELPEEIQQQQLQQQAGGTGMAEYTIVVNNEQQLHQYAPQ